MEKIYRMSVQNAPNMETLGLALRKIRALFLHLPTMDYLMGFQQWIKDRIADWEKTALRIGLVGITSAGKSTFVNALAGEDILPRGAQPTSGLLVVCRHNSPRKLHIFFKNNTQAEFIGEDCNPTWVKRYADEQENPGNEQNVREMQLSLPNLMIPPRYDLIDSPGLDAFGLQGHEELTLRTLVPMVDVVLFLTTTKSTSDRENLKALSKICKEAKPVIVIQTHKDAVESRYAKGGKILENAEEVLQKHFIRVKQLLDQTVVLKDTPVIQVSSIQALNVRTAHPDTDPSEMEEWKASGFSQISQVLTELYEKLSQNIALRRLNILCNEIRQMMERVRADYNMARGKFKEAEEYKEGELSKLDELQNAIPTEQTPDFPNAESLQTHVNQIKDFFMLELKSRDESNLENLSVEVRDKIKAMERDFFDKADKIDEKLQEITSALSIDMETIHSDEQQYPSLPELRRYEKMVRVEMLQEAGMVGRAKRLFGRILNKDEWGFKGKEVVQTCIDREGLQSDLLEYHSVYRLKLTNYLKRWQMHWLNTVATILSTINQRRDDLYRQPVKVDPVPYNNLLNEIRQVRDWLDEQLVSESSDINAGVKIAIAESTPTITTPTIRPLIGKKEKIQLSLLVPLLESCRVLHFTRRTHRFWNVCRQACPLFTQHQPATILITTPFAQELMDYLTLLADLPTVEEKELTQKIIVYSLQEPEILANLPIPHQTLSNFAIDSREHWFLSHNTIIVFHDNLVFTENGQTAFSQLAKNAHVMLRVVDLHQIGHERKRLDESPVHDSLQENKGKAVYLGMGGQQLIKSGQSAEICRSYQSLHNPPGLGLCPIIVADCEDLITSLLWLGWGLSKENAVTEELEAMAILNKTQPFMIRGQENWIRQLFQDIRELKREEAFYDRLNN